ncbi:MAG TPA: hypothetical protein VFE58_06725, partial [Tepidisphaeraceae bacterium]|nr:hypothetical protein [Tepidisphaeraceae bacterium]
MSTSPKKLSANRANSQKSTGPRTPAGKRRSSSNSLSHGLFARTIVLPTESPKLYDALKDSLVVRFNPTDTLEFLLIEKIAIACWKLQRLYRAESYAHATIASWAPNFVRTEKQEALDDGDDDYESDYEQEKDESLKDPNDPANLPYPTTPTGQPDYNEFTRRKAAYKRQQIDKEHAAANTTDPALSLFFSLINPLHPLEKLQKLEGQLERSLSRLLRDLRTLQKSNPSHTLSKDPVDHLESLLSHLQNPFFSESLHQNEQNEPTAPPDPLPSSPSSILHPLSSP